MLALASSGCGPRPAADRGETQCNRVCLEDLLDAYLRALAARDPSTVRLARGVGFVEDLQAIAIGEGTWKSVTGLGRYRHIVADPAGGSVAAVVVVEEGGSSVLMDVTLKVSNRAITQVESMVVRDTAGASRYEQVGLVPDPFLELPAADTRVSRQALIRAVDAYYSRMTGGVAPGDFSFLTDNCERMEHGNTASLGCRTQFDAGFVPFVVRVRDRRYVAVDEERQTVFAHAVLDHDGTPSTAPGVGGAQSVPAYFSVPRTLQVGEVFRLERGKIRYIETTLAEYPYGARPPLASETAQAAPSAPAVGSGNCDRGCLTAALNRWLDALVTRRRDAMPAAPSMRYTENGQLVSVGDGLWSSVTAVNRQRRILVDAATGTVGVLTGITERDVPGALAARLRVSNGAILEVEAIVARHELPPADGNTATLFGPQLAEGFEPTRFAAEWAAFDQGRRDVTGVGLLPAVTTLPPRLEPARERRPLVRDQGAAMTMELTLTDVTGAQTAAAATTGPFTVMAVSLTRERDGRTTSQTIARALPFGSGSGWRK